MRTCWLPRCERPFAGFTIVEVLVAMTVAAIGMVAVFEALRMANDAADRIRDEEAALLLAERHMVALLARPAPRLQPAHGVEGRYTWEEKVQGGKVPDIARIAVKVSWSFRGRPLSFELASMRETR